MAGVKVTLTCVECGKGHEYEIPTANAQEYRQAVLRLFYLGGVVDGKEWPGEVSGSDRRAIAFACDNDNCVTGVADGMRPEQPAQLFSPPSHRFVYTGESSRIQGD